MPTKNLKREFRFSTEAIDKVIDSLQNLPYRQAAPIIGFLKQEAEIVDVSSEEEEGYNVEEGSGDSTGSD